MFLALLLVLILLTFCIEWISKDNYQRKVFFAGHSNISSKAPECIPQRREHTQRCPNRIRAAFLKIEAGEGSEGTVFPVQLQPLPGAPRPAGRPEPRQVASPRPFPELTADARRAALSAKHHRQRPRRQGKAPSRDLSVRSGTGRGRRTAARPEARARRACGRPGDGSRKHDRRRRRQAGRGATGPAGSAFPARPGRSFGGRGKTATTPFGPGRGLLPSRPRAAAPRGAHPSLLHPAPQPRTARTTTALSREPPGQLISPQRRSRDGGAGRGVELRGDAPRVRNPAWRRAVGWRESGYCYACRLLRKSCLLFISAKTITETESTVTLFRYSKFSATQQYV